MKKINHQLLPICFLLALTGFCTSVLGAQEPSATKYVYKKSLGTLTVNPATTDPVWELSTNNLNFGELLPGQESVLTVGVQNTGQVLISSLSITTSGLGISALHNCNSIAIGQLCLINVKSQGLSGGENISGNLTVAISGLSKNVSILGTSSYYDFSVMPADVDFGNNYLGSSSNRSITLINTGNKEITVPVLLSSDPRIALSHSCGTLAPQQSCVITATASSGTAGAINAVSNIDIANSSKSVSFSANFIAATATLYPNSNSSFDFGFQDINQANTQYYSITNTNTLDLTNISIATPNNTTLVNNNCGQILASNASCSFGVRWQPSSYVGLAGTLTVSSAEITKTATLSGSVKQSTASLQSGSLVLGSIAQYGSSNTALVFKNDGNANMTLTGLSGLPAQLSITNNTCSNIAPTGICSLTVVLNTDTVVTQGTVSVTPQGATNVAPITASYTVTSSNASCLNIKTANPSLPSGTYTIDPDGAGGNAPVSAYCDMATDGGGWTRVSSTDEALKAGTLTTINIADMGLSYTSVLLVAKPTMMTKYANENSIWWSTGINPAVHGLKFGTTWYFLASPTAWRGYGGNSNSPYNVTLSGGTGWANSNYTTIIANPGGSYCNLSGVSQNFCGKAVKVAVPSGLKLNGFNDIESLYNSTSDNQSVRALDIFVK